LDDLAPYKTKSRRISSVILKHRSYLLRSSFDLDLPTECDDEYWEDPDPEKAFKQPPGKPSKVSFFISYLKLNQILGFALRTIVGFLFDVSLNVSLRFYSIPSISPKFGSVLLGRSGSSISSRSLIQH
jgi:hypothetical protein